MKPPFDRVIPDIDAYLRRCSVLISVLSIFNCNELDGKIATTPTMNGSVSRSGERDEIIINDHDHAFFGLITLLDSGCMTQSNGRRSGRGRPRGEKFWTNDFLNKEQTSAEHDPFRNVIEVRFRCCLFFSSFPFGIFCAQRLHNRFDRGPSNVRFYY